MKRLAPTVALVLATMTAPARASEAPDLSAKARHLAAALQATGPLGEAQRLQIQALLDAAEARLPPGTAPVPTSLASVDEPTVTAPRAVEGACFTEAYRYLPRDEARRLCAKGAGTETVRCYVEAHRSFATEQALQLCADRGTVRTAVCFEHASRQLDPDQALRLCQGRGTEETASCYAAAFRRLDPAQAVDLCRAAGTMRRVECFEKEWQSVSLDDAVRACSPG